MAKKKAPKKPVPVGRLQTYRPLIDRMIFGVALLGMLTTVHLWLQDGIGFDRGCLGFSEPGAAAATGDCELVTKSGASTLFGIPNILLGFLYYTVIAVLSAGVALARGRPLKRLKQVRALMIAGGFLYSAYLVTYQALEIGEYCVLCLISASLATVLLILQVVDYVRQPARAPARVPARSFREPALLGSLAVVMLLIMGADMAYFRSLDVPVVAETTPAQPVAQEEAPEGPVVCAYSADKDPIENYRDFLSFADPVAGNADASVTVIEFFDPNCGHCKSFHPEMQQIIEANKDRARFYIKPFILWERSLIQAEALYAAAQENKFFPMLAQQFEHQQPSTGLSMEQLREIAQDIGMDPDVLAARVQSGIYRQPLLQQREKVIAAGVSSVPTVLINGRIVDSASRTPACITQLIEEAAL